ncbi:MAG: thiamine-phosphate kinase [Pirellulaceae bacterium]
MESEFIAWLRERLPPHRNLRLGIGDDAAILRVAAGRDLVVTSDLLTEGVDFRLHECQPWQVGRKAVAVNLSDLAAMACQPVALLVSVALPRSGAGELARGLYQGIFDLAAEYQVALAGGDTNTWDGGLVISVTAMGQLTARGPLRRDQARPGDHILVTGHFGGSILGKHFSFDPRVGEALLLHDQYELHAGIDVSDGLSLDLHRLALASGCGAAISLDAVPIDPAAIELAADQPDGRSALDHALSDGEDFELLIALPAEEAERLLQQQPLRVPVTRIGQMVEQAGLWELAHDGRLLPLAARGYEHAGDTDSPGHPGG